MEAAVGLALLSGTAWGVNMVIVRWSLAKTGAASDVGALVSIGTAAVIALAVAVVTGADTAGLDPGNIARFSLVGAIAPGAAQVLFMVAIRTIGSARGGVLIGTGPMFAVVLAILFLDEQWRVPIVVGTIATVAGSALLGWEPRSAATAPGDRSRIGVVFALATACAFGVRDVIARHFTSGAELDVAWASAIVLGAGSLALAAITLVRTRRLVAEIRTTLPSMLWSGLTVGLALPVLLESLSRGEVGVVTPINNGAQIIAVVALSALFFGRRELSLRLVGALVLVTTGVVLIGTSL